MVCVRAPIEKVMKLFVYCSVVVVIVVIVVIVVVIVGRLVG